MCKWLPWWLIIIILDVVPSKQWPMFNVWRSSFVEQPNEWNVIQSTEQPRESTDGGSDGGVGPSRANERACLSGRKCCQENVDGVLGRIFKLFNRYDNSVFLELSLNFFPVPVEEECKSEDQRRRGICMNTYECRMKNGESHGPCALGFGVCCI
ncbi:hypothetical protein PV326_004579, partial [Microctonus aethiopoides]